MANADGSVIFSCDLDSTKAQKKLSKLRDEISELNSKLEKETGNKMNLEKQLDAASQAAKATEERVKMLRKEVERLNDREWIQKQGFTQNEYQTQVLDRRAAAEAELKQQEALLRTQTKEVKTLSAAYEETTANINSMTVKLDKAKVAAGELIANIPQLASGAVIPPNRKFLAVLGDQKSGTNVEAPLSTIKQAVMEALAQGDREPINVNLVVDGKTLARVVVPNINNMTRAAGKPVLLY